MAASGWARAAVVFLCACDLMLLLLLPPRAFAAEGPAETPGEATPPPRKKKKDIRDYNDADMARLLEQWEVRSARTPSRLFCPESLPSDLLPPLSWDPLHLRLGVFRPLNLLCPHANGPYDPLQLPLTLSPLTTSPSVCRPPPQAVHPSVLFSPFLGPLQSRVRLSLFSPICHQCPGRLRVAPRDEVTGLEVYEVWAKAMQKDDDIEEGDLPEHKRPSAPIDFSQIDPGKPESILKMTKKGKTLMMFVTVSGNPTEKETEEITSLWQGSLFNANYDVQRFIVGSDRAIFMLRDGGYAWEIKDFLVSQDRCADVTLEGQVYPGKGGGSKEKNQTKQEKGKKKKERDPKPQASKEDNRAGSKREEL
ncbi:hypothetical protein JEQ12_007792 [Ovis aries]|uniref:LRP chaperone MESD n=1 Tax=Ovis aries TaxID=9940 RepID=A0A836CT65_SHEEP|nr:hypothetical protein JEQ12_007792 [Ovis aries]